MTTDSTGPRFGARASAGGDRRHDRRPVGGRCLREHIVVVPNGVDGDGSAPPYANEMGPVLAELASRCRCPQRWSSCNRRSSVTPRSGSGRVCWAATSGRATSDHYRIGSVTKSMTATIILQLVQEGRLTLDDPVNKYVPNVPDGDNITVAQLLEMRSGLARYTNDPTFVRGSDADLTRPWTPDELLDLAFAHPAEFPPGSDCQYSNTNYILLGKIMELLTGQTVQELFQQRLFAPLGMHGRPCPGPRTPPRQHGFLPTGISTAEKTSAKPLPADEQQAAAAGTLLPVDRSEANPSMGVDRGIGDLHRRRHADLGQALVDGALLDPETQALGWPRSNRSIPISPTARPTAQG